MEPAKGESESGRTKLICNLGVTRISKNEKVEKGEEKRDLDVLARFFNVLLRVARRGKPRFRRVEPSSLQEHKGPPAL